MWWEPQRGRQNIPRGHHPTWADHWLDGREEGISLPRHELPKIGLDLQWPDF